MTKPLNADQYRGQWVALEPRSNKVVAHSVSLARAQKAAHGKGVERPIMFPVPKSGDLFIGHGTILSRTGVAAVLMPFSAF